MPSHALNFIDVFSGAGGLSCGMELAGLRCLLGVDLNKAAIQTFLANHKHAVAFSEDIKKLTSMKLMELLGGQTVHAVIGGPPCQGFSTVGRGDPKDQRNSLFLEFIRIVKITRPLFVVVENVTGLLAKKNEKTLRAIFAQFEKLGFHLDVQVLSAEKYGVPERRRRTIILGTRLPIPVQFPLFSHDCVKNGIYIPPVTVGEALANMETGNGNLYNHDLESAEIRSTIDRRRLAKIPEGKGIRYPEDEKQYLPPSLHLGVDWKELPEGRFRQTKYQRLDGKRPSPTIMTHRYGYFHPRENRYLTAREAARLQSFPNDFVFQGPVSEQWRQIGNAVPPLLGKSIGEALLQMLAKSKEIPNQKSMPKSRSSKRVQSTIENVREGAFVYKG
ncbi:MAG: DNA cytosine methyltransferase [Bdellovibrio sp.]|nr:DNA cytosine methyltransferase [Bdellovibrio sp.]